MRGRWLALGAVAAIGLGLVAGAATGAVGILPGTGALPPPRFAEAAASAGVEHRYEGDFPYIVGGGVAAFDCDDDGRQDLYIAGGEGPAALFRNVTPTGGALRFEAIPDPATDLMSVTGAYPLDVDADDRTDLVVLRLGENVVLRGLGACAFERANEALGIDAGTGWTVAFSATWEGDATLPTLAFGDYVTLDEANDPTYTCPDGRLVRPKTDGARYAAPIALSPGLCPLSMLFSSWDRSGRRDLRVSNDRQYYRDGEEQLWRIEPDGDPRLYTRGDGWVRLQLWGMGIASQDLTGDGMPEIFLTSQADNKLQTLADGPARPTYEDVALRYGVTAHRPYVGDETLPSTAWHPAFEDVNDDGYIDLFVSKGNVEHQLDHALRDPSNLLIGQADGTFVEGAPTAGMTGFGRARGAALVDLDRDGRLDIVKVIRNENVEIWRNEGSGLGGWLGVSLEQGAPNHDAIGAWIEVRVGERSIEREVTVGGGHAGGQLGPIHFGLGAADRAEVRVQWPDGEMGPWIPVEADQYVSIVRGASGAEPWLPTAAD